MSVHLRTSSRCVSLRSMLDDYHDIVYSALAVYEYRSGATFLASFRNARYADAARGDVLPMGVFFRVPSLPRGIYHVEISVKPAWYRRKRLLATAQVEVDL